VVNAKARAKTKAIFFMIVSPSSVTVKLPEPARPIRDSHHVSELFEIVLAAQRAGR
jgi:hypothetical protein